MSVDRLKHCERIAKTIIMKKINNYRSYLSRENEDIENKTKLLINRCKDEIPRMINSLLRKEEELNTSTQVKL